MTYFARLVMAAVGFLLMQGAAAQDYPTKTIKIVVPYSAGGGTDIIARLIAIKLSAKWGQPVIVENRLGAAGNIGAEAVAKAAPDGYTLLCAPPPPIVLAKSLYSKLPFDPDEFVPVSLLVTSPNVLLLNPKVPADNVKELIALAKANPGRLTYASSGKGTNSHLVSELFKSMAHIDLLHVPYKGQAQIFTDLMSGQVDVMFAEYAGALSVIRSGKVRLVAVGTEKRIPSIPDVPAVAEVLPGYVAATWFGIVATPGTPPAVAKKLSDAIAEAMKQPDIVQRSTEMNWFPVASTPEQMAAFLAEERSRWSAVIRATGTKAD